eukprot:CAMPEP_0114566092 /NCGR_PEP_ID=MMETSP0114-20121206/14694_1 /TAXON_ID=31324 /ORGANISM="Goniomonas sp, Strain m" /LENGTH=55 /DNA_ID=CAMNT_0001752453 /DNA_START=580 /DNA_END=747 /DNA_ORIENTATION=-
MTQKLGQEELKPPACMAAKRGVSRGRHPKNISNENQTAQYRRFRARGQNLRQIQK